jgi:hypothetical protein
MENKTMTIEQFIEDNHSELVACIKRACPNCDTPDYDEIENWILNDEGLYTWARSEGVDI